MADTGTAAQLSKVAIQLSAAFAVVGIGLLYVYIMISSAPETMKVLWASGLSIAVALTFLVIWTIARDVMKENDRLTRRRTSS
jgi:hypothetical protein